MTVRLFARLREIAGSPEFRREVPDGADARGVWNALVREFPGLEAYGAAVSCAINQEYARFSSAVHDGDEVAFLPPVSGGQANR